MGIERSPVARSLPDSHSIPPSCGQSSNGPAVENQNDRHALSRAGRQWRRGWDLNPRTPEGQCLSRASHSAALAPLLGAWSIARYRRTRNGGRADECTRLESGRPSRVRGFESPPFRQDIERLSGVTRVSRLQQLADHSRSTLAWRLGFRLRSAAVSSGCSRPARPQCPTIPSHFRRIRLEHRSASPTRNVRRLSRRWQVSA